MKSLPFIALFLVFSISGTAQTDTKMSELDCFTWGKPADGTNYWDFLEQKGIHVVGTSGDRNIRKLIPAKELVILNDEICLRWIKLINQKEYEFSIVDEHNKTIYKISSLECGVRLRPRQFMDTDATSINVVMAVEGDKYWGESYKIIPLSNDAHERTIKEIRNLPSLPQPQATIRLADFYLAKGLLLDALTVLENRLEETTDEEAIISKYWEVTAKSVSSLRK